jgi:hypothetical protein
MDVPSKRIVRGDATATANYILASQSLLSAMGRVEGADGALFGYSRMYCKPWQCGYCGQKKARALCRRIGETTRDRGLARFLTLTLDPRRLPKTEEGVSYIRKVWSIFRPYLKRESAIAVVELHKYGVPHMHVLVDRIVPKRWISRAWGALGGGHVVYIERVKDLRRLGWYLGRYLTKEMILSAPRGLVTRRREISSRGPERSGASRRRCARAPCRVTGPGSGPPWSFDSRSRQGKNGRGTA